MKQQNIGEIFYGGIINFETRNQLRDNEPVLRDDGKPKQELVVTLIAYAGTNMEARIGGNNEVPTDGEHVRLIMSGGRFSQWIDATDELKRSTGRGINVGDVVIMTSTHAIRFEPRKGGRELGRFVTQDELANYRATSTAYHNRQESLGVRGDLFIMAPEGEYAQLASRVLECEAAYAANKATALTTPSPPATPAPPPAPDLGDLVS